MRRVRSLLLLVGALALLGSDCTQDLFAPISCEDNAECEVACEELCSSAGEGVMSAVCDANDFCDCLCMPPTGMGGSGGMGAGGSGGSAG